MTFDFEVVRDPKENAALVETLYDPRRHHLLNDTMWITWCKTTARNPRIFGYKHLETGNTVLAVWVYDRTETTSPVFMDLETFPGDPRELWPMGLLPREFLALRLQPKAVEAPAKRRLREHEAKMRATMERRKDNQKSREKAAKILKNRNLDFAAHMMSTHQVPHQAPDDRSEELAKILSK